MKRRSFIGGMVAALASKPSPKQVAKAAGVNVSGLVGVATQVPYPQAIVDSGYAKESFARFKLLNAIRPAWFMARYKDSARHVSTLDVDLASLHSVSLAAKIAIQRERNFIRAIDLEESYWLNRIQEEAFKA